jgi:diacylglycerol kinase family enzyme
MKTVVLLNRGGGSASDRSAVEQALADAGIGAEPQWLSGRDIASAAAEAVEGGAERIVAGGGDGTIGCVAGAIAGTGAKLAILPLGTLNHFARDLGIPLDIGEAARVAAGQGTRKIDVAEVNGRIFVNNSAIGLYPLMVVHRDLQRRMLGRSKRLAMLVASLRTLLRFGHQRLTLRVNGRREQVDTPLLFVGNNGYRLDAAAAGRRDTIDKGELFVLVMRRKTRRGFIAASIRALAGRPSDSDMVHLEDVQRLRVGSRRSRLFVSLDGEVVPLEPPLDYKIRPKALTVLVP